MLGGLFLAFACAAGWAGLDVFRKQLGATIAPLPLLVLLHAGLLPVFAAWWAFEGGTVTNLGAYAVPGGCALVLQIVANVMFLAAVRVSPLSLTIPFLAFTPVFAALIGYALLGEEPGVWQLVGVGLVVVGALILGSDRSGDDEQPAGRGPRLLQVFVRERGAWLMLSVAMCWGLSTALDKRALAYATVPVHALVQLSGLLIAAAVYLLIRGRARELLIDRRELGRLALATVTGAVAFGLQLVAVQHVLISLLETIKRAVGLISAIVLGRLVFGEAITVTKVVAIVVMVAGVASLMLGTSP